MSRSEISDISDQGRLAPSRLASARGARPSSDAIRSMSGRQNTAPAAASSDRYSGGAAVPGVRPLGSINVSSVYIFYI